MPKQLTKFERKEGFYCDLTQEQINKTDYHIHMDKLHYEDLGPNNTRGNTYFVYYDSKNIDKKLSQESIERIHAANGMYAHYSNEHIDDLKWCRENKDALQPLIKKEFDDKYAKYGEDFKFDLDIFNYAFLGKNGEGIVLASLDGSATEKKETELDKVNKQIDEMMLTAAKNNTDLDLKGAIKQLGKKLENMEQEASMGKCEKAMKLAMAHYAHKIIGLDLPKEKKKELFGDILVSYKDTMATMIATIGGYDKGYKVGNIDFGCLEANNLIDDLNSVVPTEFFIDVDKNADKNKDLDTVIKNSYDNKKLAVEDKEFIGQSYKVMKEKYAKHNGFVIWLSKIPGLFPSVKKERESIEKIEKFAEKFELGKTEKERMANLTGITESKKKKVVIEMADKFVKSAEIDVNGAMKTMQGIFGKEDLDNRFRSIDKGHVDHINAVFNRFYAGKALNKISELPGVSEFYSPIDKQEIKAQTENSFYKKFIAETANEKISADTKRQFAYVYQQASERGDRETDLLTVNVDGKNGKTLEFSLQEEVEKVNAEYARLNYDVEMKGTEVKQGNKVVEEQKEINDLSNLERDSKGNDITQQKENDKNLSPAVEKQKTEVKTKDDRTLKN